MSQRPEAVKTAFFRWRLQEQVLWYNPTFEMSSFLSSHWHMLLASLTGTAPIQTKTFADVPENLVNDRMRRYDCQC